MAKKDNKTNVSTLSKKTVKRVLIGFGIGAVLLIAYLFYTGSFTSGKVYADPSGVAKADGDPKQTAINYNAMGYKVITASEDDICVATVPLAANLGLYCEGATGEGKEQAVALLNTESSIKENHAALVHALGKPLEESSFSGLFVDKRIVPKREFVEANNFFGTYFETVDFFDFVQVRDKINEIASQKTGGKISKVTETLQLNSSMVFVSGFKFREKFGSGVDISVSDGDFMGSKTAFCSIAGAKVKLFKNHNVTFLSIPLDNGFEYEVLMVDDGNFKEITMADIKGFRESAKETVASVSLPLPKVEAVTELKPALKNAGFNEPFNKDSLIGNLAMTGKSKIDKIDQMVDFEILTNDRQQNSEKSESEKVLINKPYIFMVSDGDTGCKVVMGKKTK